MERALFTNKSSGQVVPITNRGRKDFAFIPDPLPVSIQMSDRLWSLLTEANGKVERLNGLGSALPSPSILLRPLQRREALTSNSLEGTVVTPEELLLFAIEKAEAPEKGESSQQTDWREVMNYDEALRLGSQRIAENCPLNCSLLCELHGLLLRGARGENKAPGTIRDSQVFVGVERRYIPPPPETVASALQNLEEYMASDVADCHPIIRAYIAHYQFEAIHPFKDGNGRLGRLWLSLTLHKWLAHSHPWLYMSEFFEKHRKDYIEKLFRVSTHGEWSEWIEFCLLGTRAQAEDSIARCHALSRLKAEYLTRVEGPRSREIIDMLFENPFIEMPTIQKKFGVSHPTARKYVEEFEKAVILFQMEGYKSPKSFVARKIFKIAYVD
jgi:cell filamentation protein, protein adenylyltransferase